MKSPRWNTLLLTVGLLASQLPARSAEVYGGIGVELMKWPDTPYVEIFRVYGRSVAEKAGLTTYQQILSIDGKSTADRKKEECEKLLRGNVGTSVKLVLLDTRLQQTNTVTLVREVIRVVEESQEMGSKNSNEVNRVHLIKGQTSLTQLAHIKVSTNQILWVATTNDGVAGIRFLTGGESGSLTNYETNWVRYSWNYRASPTSQLISGTGSSIRITKWEEELPKRWVGKPVNSYAETQVKAGPEVDVNGTWGRNGPYVSVGYDAAVYRVRVTDLPDKVPAAKKGD
jgi:hypothetical protein